MLTENQNSSQEHISTLENSEDAVSPSALYLTEQLKALIKKFKPHRQYTNQELMKGDPATYLTLINHVLFSYSKYIQSYVESKGVSPFPKTDYEFVESIFKMLEENFNYKQSISLREFFSAQGNIDRKITFTVDLLGMIRKKQKKFIKEKRVGQKENRDGGDGKNKSHKKVSFFDHNPDKEKIPFEERKINIIMMDGAHIKRSASPQLSEIKDENSSVLPKFTSAPHTARAGREEIDKRKESSGKSAPKGILYKPKASVLDISDNIPVVNKEHIVRPFQGYNPHTARAHITQHHQATTDMESLIKSNLDLAKQVERLTEQMQMMGNRFDKFQTTVQDKMSQMETAQVDLKNKVLNMQRQIQLATPLSPEVDRNTYQRRHKSEVRDEHDHYLKDKQIDDIRGFYLKDQSRHLQTKTLTHGFRKDETLRSRDSMDNLKASSSGFIDHRRESSTLKTLHPQEVKTGRMSEVGGREKDLEQFKKSVRDSRSHRDVVPPSTDTTYRYQGLRDQVDRKRIEEEIRRKYHIKRGDYY